MAQLPPIINYDAYIISPGTDLTLTGVGTPNISAQYGDYGQNYQTGKKADCTLAVSYSNIQYTINVDNSVTVTGEIAPVSLVRTSTGIAAEGYQTMWAKFNGQQTWGNTVATGSSGTYNLGIPSSFSITIPPSWDPQPTYVASVEFYNIVTNSFSPDHFYLGIQITNPNPPDYRPGAIYDSSNNQWLSHNRAGGESHIYNASTDKWVEMRTTSGGIESDNPPSIYNGTKWVNQREIGKT